LNSIFNPFSAVNQTFLLVRFSGHNKPLELTALRSGSEKRLKHLLPTDNSAICPKVVERVEGLA
jgi:hypothetical protein